MTPYLLVGLVAAAITFVMTPLVRMFSVRFGAIDHPSDRKVHADPTPTLGGLALFAGILGAGVLASQMPEFEGIFTHSSQAAGILAGGLIIFALGVVDDLRDLPAPVKLAGQVFASGILFLSGVKMQFVLLPDAYTLSDDVSVLVTVLWLVAMINAVNLVDGLDGLAAGICAIAAAAFFVYTFQIAEQGLYVGVPTAPLVAIIIVGISLGFLRHNFHPARIFMGDSGSMLLGLVLGAATLAGVGSAGTQVLTISRSEVFLAYFPLVIPLLVIALPILDALLAIVRRARRRRSVFHADKEHLHHRLMDLGHGHRQAVLVMYLWSALAAGAGLAFTFLERGDVIFGLPIAVGAIVLYTLFPVLTKAVQERLG
ncbi:MAG: undecaprenyl/decaprenyl-phosphate alpha-N-acetylglucosaminyl 1-phosphate transferase [Actinomycetota bacterium]|nr:undecaprenyl/decaprenyl-phosphate alpha-N-acetylglucosaminyl 1-phosphate transferase [Actinomycetota bacterium]